MASREHLIPTQIIDSLGRSTTVYVSPVQAPNLATINGPFTTILSSSLDRVQRIAAANNDRLLEGDTKRGDVVIATFTFGPDSHINLSNGLYLESVKEVLRDGHNGNEVTFDQQTVTLRMDIADDGVEVNLEDMKSELADTLGMYDKEPDPDLYVSVQRYLDFDPLIGTKNTMPDRLLTDAELGEHVSVGIPRWVNEARYLGDGRVEFYEPFDVDTSDFPEGPEAATAAIEKEYGCLIDRKPIDVPQDKLSQFGPVIRIVGDYVRRSRKLKEGVSYFDGWD